MLKNSIVVTFLCRFKHCYKPFFNILILWKSRFPPQKGFIISITRFKFLQKVWRYRHLCGKKVYSIGPRSLRDFEDPEPKLEPEARARIPELEPEVKSRKSSAASESGASSLRKISSKILEKVSSCGQSYKHFYDRKLWL